MAISEKNARSLVIENAVTMICAITFSSFLIWYTKSLWGLLGLIILVNMNYFNASDLSEK